MINLYRRLILPKTKYSKEVDLEKLLEGMEILQRKQNLYPFGFRKTKILVFY
jgi:hypothetical protein